MNTLFIRGIRIDWSRVEPDSYLREIEAIRNVDHIELECPVTFFVGENGSGKSTLLEAIAVSYGFNPEGGTRNYAFSTYNSHSPLYEATRLIRSPIKAEKGYFLRAESFYNVATAEEEYSKGPGGIPQHYHEKSHGESFLAVAQNYFAGNGVYLLDEPEAALSPQLQLTLLVEIDRCVKAGAQFLIVTHSPILLAFPNAQILTFDDGKIHPCGYEDTDSYQITSMFVNKKEQILRQLLSDQETI